MAEVVRCVVVVYRWVEGCMGPEESAVGKVNRGALILRARLNSSTDPSLSFYKTDFLYNLQYRSLFN